MHSFLANVNYMSLAVRLSVVCLSVTFVRPTQAIEIFGNVSTPFGTLAICWHTGTRNSSGDEIANVNFLYHDIVHALKYNRLLYKFHNRSFSATQVYQIQWNNAMQRPLRRSRSIKVTDFGTNRKLIYDFLLVINTNLPPILHRFQVMADYWSNFR